MRACRMFRRKVEEQANDMRNARLNAFRVMRQPEHVTEECIDLSEGHRGSHCDEEAPAVRERVFEHGAPGL